MGNAASFTSTAGMCGCIWNVMPEISSKSYSCLVTIIWYNQDRASDKTIQTWISAGIAQVIRRCPENRCIEYAAAKYASRCANSRGYVRHYKRDTHSHQI